MAYIGLPPKANFTSGLLDRFTSTTGTTVTLTHDIASENDIVVFVNFVKQDSTTYSVGGTGNKTLTLGGTLVSSDIAEVHYLNIVGQTVNPSANSVGSSQLTADSITGQTAETSIATDDTILIHDTSASALKKMTRANFVSGIGGDNTPAFYANRTSGNQSLSHDTATKVQFNVETFDTDGTYDHSTNYRWTPGVVGKYIIGVGWWCLGNDTGRTFNCYIYKNGSQHMQGISRFNSDTPRFRCNDIFTIDVTSTSDYFEAYAKLETNNGNAMEIHAGSFSNYFYGYKLIT